MHGGLYSECKPHIRTQLCFPHRRLHRHELNRDHDNNNSLITNNHNNQFSCTRSLRRGHHSKYKPHLRLGYALHMDGCIDLSWSGITDSLTNCRSQCMENTGLLHGYPSILVCVVWNGQMCTKRWKSTARDFHEEPSLTMWLYFACEDKQYSSLYSSLLVITDNLSTYFMTSLCTLTLQWNILMSFTNM